MGSLNRRLTQMEERIGHTPDHKAEWTWGEFLRRLTEDELAWMVEPMEEAQSLVPCPHVETVECQCRSDERGRRGLEAYPNLLEEYVRRRDSLLARSKEIIARSVKQGVKNEHG